MDEELDINGTAPNIAGDVCESVIFELYIFKGDLQPGLIGSYLKFGGQWHRLYFDCGIIFWRTKKDEPKPYSAPEEGRDYPHKYLSEPQGILGCRLLRYTMVPTHYGSYVDFEFDSGKHLILEDKGDVTSYKII